MKRALSMLVDNGVFFFNSDSIEFLEEHGYSSIVQAVGGGSLFRSLSIQNQLQVRK